MSDRFIDVLAWFASIILILNLALLCSVLVWIMAKVWEAVL